MEGIDPARSTAADRAAPTRPRVLVLLSRAPWPLDDGGRVGLFQIVSSLSRRFDVTALVMVAPEQRADPIPAEIRQLGIQIVRVPHRPSAAPVAMMRGLLGRWPYTLARFRNRDFDRELRRLVRDRSPAFAYVSSLHMATYGEALGATPVVLREQNVEHRWLERYAGSIRNPFARAFARHQARRLRHAEAELCQGMSLVLAIHEEEAGLIRQLCPGVRVEVIPIGVDPGRFIARSPDAQPTVLVLGAFGWPPNRDGLRRFLAEGWPALRRRVPGATLRVVGKDLPADLRSESQPGIEVVGYVDSVAEEFARASLLIVPLWVGAGARVKIVEALMAGTPVVSTSLGAEGLGLIPGHHLLIADTPEDLAAAAADLLGDRARAEAMGAAGRSFALARFSLDAVAQRTGELCAAVIRQDSGSRA